MIEENVEWKGKKARGDENQKYENRGVIVSNLPGLFEDESMSKTQKTESEFSKGKLNNRDENYYFSILYSSTYKYI